MLRQRLSSLPVPVIAVAVAVLALVLASCGGWQGMPIDAVEADGRRLLVGVHCEDDARVQVEESADEVVLSLQGKGRLLGECADAIEVLLDEPPGDRTVIDKANGEPMVVEAIQR